MYNTKAYSAASAASPLASAVIPRREPTERDVQIEILFCGICHSDLHYARDEWHDVMPTVYPCVPGHEIVGRVTAVGAAVTKYQAGDLVGVGCLVDSDHTCPHCQSGHEQFCPNMTLTYGSPDKHGTAPVTYGGYSDSIVVDERFVLRIPANLDLAGAAPLLCAGITTYSPLRHWGVTKGKKVGIVGLGGLGHMGVKFARAFGAHTVVFTTSPSKVEDALRLGADEVVISKNPDEMAKHAGTFDFILDCVAAEHDINAYINLLAVDGNLTMVGAPEKPLPVHVFGLIFGRRSFSGSPIGGLAETQEMLDFCGEHNITADVEIIPVQKINEAYERMLKSDVKYRFSIDMASLRAVLLSNSLPIIHGKSALPFTGSRCKVIPGGGRFEIMSQNIQGKVVVITGASSGLGEATARLLSAEGATVVLGARRADRIQALAEELNGKGGKALAVTTDVTKSEQVQALVNAAVQTYGRIDVIINNAGLMPNSLLERLKIEDWDRTIDVNIKGVLYGIAAALPYMKEQKSGQIINVSSVAGHKIRAGNAVYSATKHAVRALSEGLRLEVKPYNIRTTVISPGAVATELPDSITEADVAANTQRFYEDIAIPADSFARAVVFAMSQPEDVDINEILFRPTRQEL